MTLFWGLVVENVPEMVVTVDDGRVCSTITFSQLSDKSRRQIAEKIINYCVNHEQLVNKRISVMPSRVRESV